MTRNQRKPKQERKINISKVPLSLGLVIVFASAMTQLRGEDAEMPSPGQLPVVSIHSTGDVPRGKTGSFVLVMSQSALTKSAFPYYPYVNFKVSGTAIPGVDYVALVSPAYIGPSGYGVIQVQTLPDPRASSIRRSYSVVVTLETGAGYAVGAPSSAQMMIKP